MDQNKFNEIQKRSNKQIARFIITGLVFGFITEWMLGNSTIYDNIIKKTTMRRLSKQLIIQQPKRKKICASKKDSDIVRKQQDQYLNDTIYRSSEYQKIIG